MRYPIVIHKDRKSDYGVTVPDLPGCFSAGKTMDEALNMAKEAIELHLEGLMKEGLPIPQAGAIDRHKRNPDFGGGVWDSVEVDFSGTHKPAERLAAYLRGLRGFTIETEIGGNYEHMGATITDGVLQPGVNYKRVVRPRVQRLLREYPSAKTTSQFSALLKEHGAKHLLNWNGDRKLTTMRNLIELLISQKIETEMDFKHWLQDSKNGDKLRKIKGIKDKSVNYFGILVGLPDVAVDRYMKRVLADSGLGQKSYEETRQIIKDAAGLLKAEPHHLDYSIWKFYSENNKRKQCMASSAVGPIPSPSVV